MAIIKANGNDDVGSDFPWFWKTDITCPRCSCTFRLTHEETLPGVVGPVGATNSLWLGWRQVVEGTAQTAAQDVTNLHVDPAQVYGACPWCGYNPIVVRGPRYGLAKTTLASDPATGLIQSRIAIYGATTAIFVRTRDNTLIALLLAADGTPIPYNTDVNYVASIRRLSATAYDAATAYPLATPATPVTATVAAQFDAALVAMLVRMGIAVI